MFHYGNPQEFILNIQWVTEFMDGQRLRVFPGKVNLKNRALGAENNGVNVTGEG